MTQKHEIIAGFLPLLDSALLVIAKEEGFAEAEAIDLQLAREVSWANIRDRLAVSRYNVAHMLAPMPIACNLGLTPLAPRMIVPMALGLGGNAVTVSNALWAEMAAAGATADLAAGRNGERASQIDIRAIQPSAAGALCESRHGGLRVGLDPIHAVG